MSNNRKKVSISADLIPQIYELSAVKCLNDESTIVLVLDIFKEITSKIDVCMKAFHARLSIMNETMAFHSSRMTKSGIWKFQFLT